MKAATPFNERQRLAALDDYQILDTPREADFDAIIELVANICRAPIAVVNLIAEDRQWFKAEMGLGVRETPLDTSLCAHAILQPDLLVVPDTTLDDRFSCNPLVTGEPKLRFYAGALLMSTDGFPLGTLCVLDTVPRELDEEQVAALRILAGHVMNLLELRRSTLKRAELTGRLQESLDSHQRLLDTVSHDLRTPLGTVALTAHHLEATATDVYAREAANRLKRAVERMSQLVDDLIDEESRQGALSMKRDARDLEAILSEVVDLFQPMAVRAELGLELDLPALLPAVCCDAYRTGQVLTNLVGNAVKFTPAGGEVVVQVEVEPEEVRVTVRDSGPGIAPSETEAAFEPYWRSPAASAEGTGLGLAIARRLVKAQGGRIGIDSELGQGTAVWFTLTRAFDGVCE